ncbi:hypothetical protein DOT_1838 [Desulfosporosinus sp. OT]|nr:hypothetical protein DOT_1838 [Desulfosporosinus sp. OT]
MKNALLARLCPTKQLRNSAFYTVFRNYPIIILLSTVLAKQFDKPIQKMAITFSLQSGPVFSMTQLKELLSEF